MKKTVVFLLSLVLLSSIITQSSYAQDIGVTPTVFFCVGDNPQPPCATIAPTQPIGGVSPSVSPSSPVSQTPSSNPSPSTNPCVSQSSVSAQNAGNSSVSAYRGKRRRPNGNGFIRQFFQFLLQLFQMFFQQMGNQTPGTTPTPSPVTNPSTQPSSGPTTNPCPSTPAPSSAVSPSTQPSQAPSATSNPTNGPTCTPRPKCLDATPRCTVAEPIGGWCPVSPTVAPTSEASQAPAPSATPTPTPSNNLLQQLLQLLIQLLQQLLQLIGVQPPSGTPTPTPAPSTSPSGSVSQSPAPSSPSSAPSTSPSGAPSPTIFGVSPSPSTAPSTATSPSAATSPSTATSKTPGVPGETGVLMSDLNAAAGGKLCMDDKGNSNVNNNAVVAWQCNSGDKAQKWTQYNDNSIRINGKCLDVTGQKTAPGSAVAIYTCNGGKNQQWSLIPIASTTSPGRTELKSAQSGLCLDIKGAATAKTAANGTPLDINTCKDAANQAWHWNTGTVTPPGNVGGGATVKNSGQLKSGLTAKQVCLDAKGNTAASGTVAQTYLCNSSDAAQQWKGYSDNTIRFTHNGSTACLDVVGQGKTNGTNVDLFACNGGANQVWTMNSKSQLESKNAPGKCLDIKGGSTASPGPQLEIYTCKTTGDLSNQKWSWGKFNSTGGTTGGGGSTTQWAYLAPTGLKVTSHTATSVNLSWNAVTGSKPTVPGGVAKPKTYTVAIYTASTGKPMKQITSSLNATTASVTGLTKNSTINIHVWANGGPLAPANAALNNYKL